MEFKNRLLIVDGMALLFRAFYASSYSGYIRKTQEGIPTNAIFGFLQYLFDAMAIVNPSHVCCCWDMGNRTFRNDWYANYKSNRVEPPQELIPQFELVKEVVRALHIPNVGVEGYEADDCIGTIVHQYCQNSITEGVILTGDHDLLQLLSPQVSVMMMNRGKANYTRYTPELLLELKGLEPHQIPDVKGFMGDSSDNYPGVKGIGEKTANQLIRQFGSVEGVLTNLSECPSGTQSKIRAEHEMLLLCKRLATIHQEVPLELNWEQSAWNVDIKKASEILDKFEMPSLMKPLLKLMNS